MSQDLFSSLKNYANKLSNGEKSSAEVAAALNVWLKESGDSIKEKIESEVERSLAKMGFAKKSDLSDLLKRIELLEKQNGATSAKAKTSNVKKKVVKKSAKRTAK
jgi:polyhydroxyalkanoate synthesis regulator phasin